MTFGTLVDSNVLLDIITEDETWFEWSSSALADAADDGPVFINPIIYAEVSVRFSRIEDVEEALPRTDYGRLAVPWESAFLAGCQWPEEPARRRTRELRAGGHENRAVTATRSAPG